MFTSIISEGLYSDMQHIEDCPLSCNLFEIMPIRDLSGQFGKCKQQCETSLFFQKVNEVIYSSSPISTLNFNTIAEIVFEKACLQDFIAFLKTKGHYPDKKPDDP